METCSQCGQDVQAGSLDFKGICDACFEWNKWHPRQEKNPAGCRLFEYGQENPMDPKGSTAHVRDIKARRLDVKTGQTYNDTGSKTYFFPK